MHLQTRTQNDGEECNDEEVGEKRRLARDCALLAEGIRDQANLLAKTVNSPEFDRDFIRKLIRELQNQIAILEQEDGLLLQSLSEERRVKFKTPIRMIDQSRRFVIERLNTIDQEFLQFKPNFDRIGKNSTEMGMTMETWRGQYLKIDESKLIQRSNKQNLSSDWRTSR